MEKQSSLENGGRFQTAVWSGLMALIVTLLLGLLLGLAGPSWAADPAPVAAPTAAPPPEERARVQVSLSQIPLHFEPNQGQTADDVKFLARVAPAAPACS